MDLSKCTELVNGWKIIKGPEWIYVEQTPEGGLIPTLSRYAATHRYQAGKPETMEKMDE